MSEKLIKIGHHVDDYECMWNGIEDLYIAQTGESIPSFFFFVLAGTGNFIYFKTPKDKIKRIAVWNDGRTKKMYERLAPIAGFSFRHTEGTGFTHMLKKAKESIDSGEPVVLGCLDMFYLQYYPKFYHREHIPIHYVLMVGYSDERQCAYIQDCGIAGVQELSFGELEEALDVSKTSLAGKNGMCAVHFEEKLPDMREIAERAFYEKAQAALNQKVGFAGIRGMRKLAKEFGCWRNELCEEDYQAVLRNIVMFTGTVPILPDALLSEEERTGIPHRAQREKLTKVLDELSVRYGAAKWDKAAREFEKSGALLSGMTDLMADYLLDKRGDLSEIPELINEIAGIEERAFDRMLDAAECDQEDYNGI